MRWSIEYFEQADTTQPAEVFEDALDRSHPKLAAKLARIAEELERTGPSLEEVILMPAEAIRASGSYELFIANG